MKRRWVIVSISSVALISAGILVRTERKNRQLAKRAVAYRIRAEQGDAKSQSALAASYYYGDGVSKDYVEAAHWYLKAAEQGNINGQVGIASMYFDGKGVPQDRSESARWCRRAAEQGDSQAQYGLGIFYTRGQGVPQDYAEAVRWYRKSADQGYPKAQYALGLCSTTVTACNGIEFRPATCLSKLPLTATTKLSERSSATGKVFRLTPARALAVFNKPYDFLPSVDENRWDEKAGLRTGCGVRSQVIDVLEAQIKRRPAMKKVITTATMQSRNLSQQKLTIGLDLGDRTSWYCALDEAGKIQLEQRVATSAKGLQEVFGSWPRSRVALEIGTHSPWISRLLAELGHEVIVANARKVG